MKKSNSGFVVLIVLSMVLTACVGGAKKSTLYQDKLLIAMESEYLM
ncbi:MAG: hypothetical protein GX228_06840 [Firmicutes bacterium]|nr:hypothetical protein [Bacillota bacterium]NLL88628.1 hypothetical protein [Bacillota bacterium]